MEVVLCFLRTNKTLEKYFIADDYGTRMHSIIKKGRTPP